ncbi:hypothetical protein CAC42_6388 [Sphaceloma murrayae]|uniref:DUF7703 domain-containing protein n=1 Tax=Sphaceloma murrayae TaxID=2082308 RepID=A0A2K1QMR4_9PEZI|nr:hypothetical protein CAC42_6388 [Sphaceloma murrayae]
MADPPVVLTSWTSTTPSNGIAGGYTGDNVNILRAMIAFSAIAWYNCAELIFLICLRFKRWRGLYFWSLMVTSWAIVLYQLGSWGKMRNIVAQPVAMTVVTNIGWIVMITGNSLVLYSRLHLLCQNKTLLRAVLYGIVVNTVCMYVPTTALDIGTNVVHPGSQVYINGYSVMERVQMTMFTLQEFIISGIYLVEAYRYLKVAYIGDKRSRNVMYELLAVNVTIIVLDIALLSVAHKDLFQIEVTLKGLVYSIKLKLELGVLSRLVRIVTTSGSALGRSATLDNDLANLSDEPKAFHGLEFCTSPLPEKSDAIKIEHTPAKRPSVPWLMTNTRSVMLDSPRSSRRTGHPWMLPDQHLSRPRSTSVARKDSNPSPLRSPIVQRPTQHTIQRGESYANSEFLTSAAVTEGANDETLRQFQKEIEAELGGGDPWMDEGGSEETLGGRKSGEEDEDESGTGMQGQGKADGGAGEGSSVGSRDAGPEPLIRARSSTSTKEGLQRMESVEEQDEEQDEEDEDEEEEWARGLGVLGRPAPSRESSLGRLYPGRITGERG